MPFWENKINITVCHLRNTETFMQLSLTRARAHTHSGRRCGNTWFLGAALGARHLLSRLHSCIFSTLPVPAAGTRGVLSWAATPPHLCITTPKSTRQRHPPPTHTHTGSSIQHTPPASQLDLYAPPFTCATGDNSTVWKVTDGALTRYSLLLNSWIRDRRWSGGGSPRWCGCNFRRVPLNGSLL